MYETSTSAVFVVKMICPPTFSTSTRNPQQNLSYFVQSKDVWNQPQKRRAEPHITSLSFLILGRPTESQWVSLDIHWCGFNFFKNARISQARFHLIAQWGHSKGNDVERQKWQTNDTERSSGLVNSWRTWRGLMTYIQWHIDYMSLYICLYHIDIYTMTYIYIYVCVYYLKGFKHLL